MLNTCAEHLTLHRSGSAPVVLRPRFIGNAAAAARITLDKLTRIYGISGAAWTAPGITWPGNYTRKCTRRRTTVTFAHPIPAPPPAGNVRSSGQVRPWKALQKSSYIEGCRSTRRVATVRLGSHGRGRTRRVKAAGATGGR